MTEHRLERTGEPDLVFSGEKIAESSSRKNQDQPRWTELIAFKTDSGKWILSLLGKSALPGEITKSTALIAKTPEEFVQFLYKPMDDGSYRLTFPGKALLRQLKDLFPEIQCFDQIERI